MFFNSTASKKTIASFLLLLSAQMSARATEVVLRDDVSLSGGIVRLADIAEVRGSKAEVADLSSVRLLPAPRGGEVQAITRQQIRELLSLSGIEGDSYEISGAEIVQVKSSPISKSLQPAQAISHSTGETSAAIFTAGGNFPGEGAHIRTRTAADMRRDIQTGVVSLLGKVRPEVPRWNVSMTIPREHEASLVSAELVEVRGGVAPYIGKQSFEVIAKTSRGNEVVGVEAVVHAVAEFAAPASPAADAKTAKRDARGEIVVKRGESVRVRAIAAGVTVTTSAKAMADGAIGEVIELEVDGHRSRVSARVVAPQLLEIYAAGPQVATATK